MMFRCCHSRIFTALTLIASLWVTTIGAAAVPLHRQQQSQNEQPQQQKDADVNKTSAPTAATPAAATSSAARPLSKNEDPRLIGKRDINTGIIAKASGSLEKEVALGRQVAAEVERQAKFVEDPIITEYVNRVGQNVVLHSDAKVPFTIKVIDSDDVNAFALPGGFFYVNKGLLLAADNEAEIAGVMAHEIAHVAARHAVENQTKGMLTEIGLIAGSIFLGGILGAVINNAAGLGAALQFMRFSRGAETEADRLGAQYLYAAGYDPNSMATMFEKLSAKNKKKPGFISKAFSTHPQSIDRLQTSRALVARFPEREEYVLNTSEFQRVKARLLRFSNARASTTGDIASGGDGGVPGRPTLKRRQPTPEDSSTTTADSDTQSPAAAKPSDAPKLKRTSSGSNTSTQPSTTP